MADQVHKRTTSPSKRTEAKNLAGSAVSSFFGALVQSRIGIVVAILVALALFGALFDVIANYGRAYSGVSVGGIDVGGLNADQIREAVAQEYEHRLKQSGVIVYSNRQVLNDRLVDSAYGDEITVEEERKRRVSWNTSADDLQAYIDYDTICNDALAVGRENIAERFNLLFNTCDVDVSVSYNDALVDSFASEIDASIGKPLVNYGVVIDAGNAVVTEGSDGDMIDREVFKQQLTEELLTVDADNRSFVATTTFTPVRISKEQAQSVADSINSVISGGIRFVCGAEHWQPDPYTIGSWIETNVTTQDNKTWELVPSLSVLSVRSDVLSNIQPVFEDGEGHVRFKKEADGITVNVTSKGTFPLVGDVLDTLSKIVFTNEITDTISRGANGLVEVALQSATIPSSMPFSEALSYGVITPISEFTTEYATGAEARNTNIHLAADLINDSIITSGGGIWSFNDTAGECNEEKGFQAATAIAGNSTIDEIGGGICQVATTVFNAVYLAGYPITERYNHSLYIPSYPQGRDAAISWPKPDFRWENDGTSDLLLHMTYTNSSVTATLYGVDMGYTVESQEGEWLDGEPFTTVYEVDNTLPVGTEYVKTTGSNGHSITVTRTVKDAEGSTLREDTFLSVYNPQNTIIVRGGASSQSLYSPGV